MKRSIDKVYAKTSYLALSVSIFFLLLFLNFFLLTRTTTWEQYMSGNSRMFLFWSISLSILNNLLIAVAVTFLIYIVEMKRKLTKVEGTSPLVSTFLSLISVGCTVCGGFLLPLVGVAASLTAFPFQGLEIKVLSILLLLFSLSEFSKRITGVFIRPGNRISHLKKYKLLYASLFAVVLVYSFPRLPYGVKQKLGIKSSAKTVVTTTTDQTRDTIFDEINPEAGYEINASYGDLGPRMLEMGVIDFAKFKETYEKGGQPLTAEQVDILTKSSNKKVKITRDNSYFLLNFFWAAGLANKSKALTEGDIQKYGEGQVGNFASTGGWTLAKGNPMDYYAKETLIQMTSEQEQLSEKVASNVYRPCCGNSTAFPDCNHGMALLAILQLMAANGATENQMYEGAKYFNAFFFPGNYYDLALYFKNKEGKSFKEVDNRILLSNEFSSGSGWQNAKKWLADKGIIKEPPKQGGGCGV